MAAKRMKVVRASDMFVVMAAVFAVTGVVYLTVGLVAGWRLAWGPMTSAYFWIYPLGIVFAERWRYSGQKQPLPIDAVVARRPIDAQLLLAVFFGGCILLIGVVIGELAGGLLVGSFGGAIGCAVHAHWLNARAETSGVEMFVRTGFFTVWDRGIYEYRRPGWYSDPAGRHQQRQWDGAAWSTSVCDDGVVSDDPVHHVPSEPWVTPN